MTTRLENYETRTAHILLVLALVFLALYGAPLIWTDLPDLAVRAFNVANVAIWLLFAVDLAIRTYLSNRPFYYLATHPVDVVIMLLPMLRPLRVLRALAAAQALITRTGRISLFKSTQAISVATALLVVVGALAILDAERSAPEATISTFGESLWWSLVTVTTVGYGDMVPVTTTGRIVAAALMLVGIALIGAVTATVAAWFIDNTQAAGKDAPREGSADEIGHRLAALEQQITEIHALARAAASAREPSADQR